MLILSRAVEIVASMLAIGGILTGLFVVEGFDGTVMTMNSALLATLVIVARFVDR